MGLGARVNAIYNATVQSVGIRYRTHPNDVAGVAVADDAAWDQIIAATVITTVFHHLVGINAYTFGTAADFEEQVEEGVGGADGAAIAPADTLVRLAISLDFASAVGLLQTAPTLLPVPVRVERAADRHAMRLSTSAVGGQALVASITIIEALGAAA